MSEDYIRPYTTRHYNSFIIELTESDAKTMAQALHVMIANSPHNHTYAHALQTLVDQCEHVSLEAAQHAVYVDPLTMPTKTKLISDIYYKPVDFYD